jgi:hypothetical protein
MLLLLLLLLLLVCLASRVPCNCLVDLQASGSMAAASQASSSLLLGQGRVCLRTL